MKERCRVMKRFEGKTAVITGGSSGIGRVTALAFAKEGAKVAIADVAVKAGEDTVRRIKRAGGEAIFIKTDVSQAREVEALINKVVEVYGRLDFAFNNAGIREDSAPTADYPEESWDRIISTNLKGVWLCMKYEIPQMLKQAHGTIVNASSIAGVRGVATSGAYSAAKHGVIGVTESASLEYAKDGIRVNAVCPGVIDTPMEAADLADPQVKAALTPPIGRVGRPDEIAEVVLWLCSEAASFVTGQAIIIDGGATLPMFRM